MIGMNFMEEIDSGSFFDHIDDLLEFPNDDIDIGNGAGGGEGGVDCCAFPPFWSLDSPDSELPRSSAGNTNTCSDLSAELSVPYEDIVHLEWLSSFVEDSFSGGGLTLEKNSSSSSSNSNHSSSHSQFRTSSPISVLESSSACSNKGGKTIPTRHEKRARSKRPRPPTFTPRTSIIEGPESHTDDPVPSKKGPKPIKKIKILPILGSDGKTGPNQDESPNENPLSQTVRKCMHCEITKTPQWRAGPMGPKTLCNACGVRYKSGRLFPEYRPAASPTFIPSLHSNSHKKVLEMRTTNTGEKSVMVEHVSSMAPELIPKSDLLPAFM